MLIAKYKFDSSLYDLIPEFNSGYTGYTYTDEVDGEEIIITTEQWIEGSLTSSGVIDSPDYPDAKHTDFISITPNTKYFINKYAHCFFYNQNKDFISSHSVVDTNGEYFNTPENAYYIRLYRGAGGVSTNISSAIKTRTIECDTLPTMMRFGTDGSATDKSKSLIEILDMNTSELTHMNVMFRQCTNLTKITCEWDTSKVVNFNSMFSACGKLEKVDVSDWDVGQATSFSWMFEGVKWDTIDVSNWDVSNVTATNGMFYGCHNILNLDVSNWITNKVTVMNYMFHGCNGITTLDVSKWDTSKVTSMSYMFKNCQSLTTLDVSNWDTSKVTNMQDMFYNCRKLATLDVGNWDTSQVTSMSYMFKNCQSLTTLDVGNWDTSNVTDMSNMFAGTDSSSDRVQMSLSTLDVSNWNISKVTDIGYMFQYCAWLTSLDVSNWNTSKVTNMRGIFYYCHNLLSIDVSNWDISKAPDLGYMFLSCQSLTSLDLHNWDISKVTNVGGMISNCSKLETLDISKFKFSDKIGNLSSNFKALKYVKCNDVNMINKVLSELLPTNTQGTIVCKQRDLSDLDMATLNSKNWTVTNEPILVAKYVFDKSIYNNTIPEFNTDFEGYFIEDVEVEENEVTRVIESCGMLPDSMQFGQNWTQNIVVSNKSKSLLEVNYVNTDNINKVSNMFRYNTKLRKINCEDWNLGGATSLSAMFGNCESLRSVDLSKWDTSKITHTDSMFCNCAKLQSVNLSNWNVENITVMGDMFIACDNLVDLNISNWKISSLSSCNRMFQSCRNLPSLDLSNWDMSNVTNGENIFSNTLLLTDIGMLNCNKSTIRKIVDLLPTDINRTIWYKEANVEGITVPSHVKLREYKEENVEIVLNSPLLEGDTIEMVDGNLCHVHRWKNVVLDGSQNMDGFSAIHDGTYAFAGFGVLGAVESNEECTMICESLKAVKGFAYDYWQSMIYMYYSDTYITRTRVYVHVPKDELVSLDRDGFSKWLSENPVIAIYQLAEPTYENITPLQSELTLKTLEECSMEIITNLPIKTNITYRTNITSVYELERQVNSVDTSGVSLANLIEEEVDE